MRSDTKISKRTVDALRSEGSRCILWDSELRGFGVLALESGIKSYIVNYRARDGRYRRLTIGQHGRLTAEEARKIAKKRFGEIADGLDPLELRDTVRNQKKLGFRVVAEDFITKHVAKTRSGGDTERILRLYVLSRFGDRSVLDVRRRDIAELLDDIEAAKFKAPDGRLLGGPVMADRVLAALRKLVNWHATRDDTFVSPIVHGMSRTKPRERARQRVLSDDELVAFWSATAELIEADDTFAKIARMLLVTAQRRNEVAYMAKPDIDRDLWTISESRSKNGQENLCPLTGVALSIIASQKSVGPLVFSTTGKTPYSGFSRSKRRLDELMLAKLNKLAEERGDQRLSAYVQNIRSLMKAAKQGDHKAQSELNKRWWTLHDLRRTAKTLMVRAGVRPDISERVLGHIIPGVEGTYDRHTYLPEKRDALERLSTLIRRIVGTDESRIVEFVPPIAA